METISNALPSSATNAIVSSSGSHPRLMRIPTLSGNVTPRSFSQACQAYPYPEKAC